jgi:hypothetical protein
MPQEDYTKRIHVTFTKDQWELIKKFKGIMGQNDAEIVRNIVLSWLAEKSIVTTVAKVKITKGEEHGDT